MINKSKLFLNFIKGHKFWSAIILIIIISLGYYFISNSNNIVSPNFVLVEKGTIREEVSVTGNVKPLSDVSLAFERGGRVANLDILVGDRVYIGQYLASLSNDDLIANLAQAKANLKKVQVGLGDGADQAVLTLAQAKTSLVNSIKDSYTKADDAVRNKIFSLFNDPSKYNARLIFTTDSFLQEDIEDGKDEIVDTLDAWLRILNKTDISLTLETNYNLAKTNLLSAKALLEDCAEAVNGLSVDSSGQTQTQIDTWKLNISTARTNINLAIDTLVGSYDTYKSADLAVKISGNTTLSEEAEIERTEAQVKSAEAELAKTIVRSPINGVITSIDTKLGEIVPASKNVISVISYGDYEVESFVPEADISKIKIGNMASTTLDAYGSSIDFGTMVIKVDPAATVIDGVPTYKVTLRFMNQDERIKSGMTSNLDILTAEKTDVLIVPARAVYSKNGDRFVKILNFDNTVAEIKVEIGLKGYDGQVEILTGIEKGDKVVTSL